MKKSFSILLIILLFGSSYLYGQCNVKIRDGGDQVAFDSDGENLHKNKDLENGLFSIYSSSTLIYDKSDMSLHKKHMISIIVGTSGSKKGIIPRELKIIFKNGKNFTLKAENIADPKNIDGTKIIGCGFSLVDNQTILVLNQLISKIIITDNRTHESISVIPYDGIFKEQLKCIILKASTF